MEAGLIVMLALSTFVIVTALKGVRQVPQGYRWVVQRLGKFHSSLNPGLNFIAGSHNERQRSTHHQRRGVYQHHLT
jgi:regulator of protease activity HflC (stomatin/prohibitin superfamily)